MVTFRKTVPSYGLVEPFAASFASLTLTRAWKHLQTGRGQIVASQPGVKGGPSSPLRPEVIRLAIVLLFTTGIRRAELLRLTMGEYESRDTPLLIRESKFHKSRLLPLHSEIAAEIERHLRARALRRLPHSADRALKM
jgi:integrase/recombinase XerD